MEKISIAKCLSLLPTLHKRSDILRTIRDLLQAGQGGYYVAINPEKIHTATINPKILEILSKSNFTFVDGIGVNVAYRLLLDIPNEIVTGVDLVTEAIEHNQDLNLRIGLYGSSPEVVQKTRDVLSEKYSKSKVVFALPGYKTTPEDLKANIENHKPHLVFVALGSPGQEIWITDNRQKFPGVLFTGVGGSFDVISGKIKRAPLWTRKYRLEWLYRFCSEPLKRWKRMSKLFLFGILVLKNKVFK